MTIPPPAEVSASKAAPAKTALAALASLPIKGKAPLTGYSRAKFGPAWTDNCSVAGCHNHCDTRDDILRRDLTKVVIRPGTHGCIVAKGVLRDPYTNKVINFTRGPGTSTVVQIDHIVPLADAWQTGAQKLSMAMRINLANDPLELLAVSGRINDQKGNGDAATWLPPNKSFRCRYVALQVAVKIRYHLWVTKAEHNAIQRVLSTCPKLALPTSGGRGPATAAPAPAKPPAKAPAKPPAKKVVTPGAFCTPAGARGVTTKGKAMVCKLDKTGKRFRWASP